MRHPNAMLPLIVSVNLWFIPPTSPAETFDVTIRVQADHPRGNVEPVWRFFGYDEGNYTFHPEGEALLGEIAALKPQPAYIRCHHLLTSGDGTVSLKWSSTNIYTEDAEGEPVYDWTLVDRIFDTYVALGLRPLVEIGFMPEALSRSPENYTPERVFQGMPKGMVGGGAFQPAKDYRKWSDLIAAWMRHCADRYGEEETEAWYWELWNEPNIGYWEGTLEEYCTLYDHTAHALKTVLPGARVGGPHVTSPTSSTSEAFLRGFLEHCLRGKNAATNVQGAPIDFVAFHAKGGTAWVDDHVRMNLGGQLAQIDRGLRIIGDFPELRTLPVIVGESDPDGCAACSARFYPQYSYRNGAHYASYTAATFLREQDLAETHGMRLEGALTWAFTFPDQPWFDGFRTLATNGVTKPVFNVFRMFSLLQGTRIAATASTGRSLESLKAFSVRGAPDVDAFATRGDRSVVVLVWHYHDDGVAGPAARVNLEIGGLPKERTQASLTEHRIDDRHSNAHTAWIEMGSPAMPDRAQRDALEQAGNLATLRSGLEIELKDGLALTTLELPRQGISLLEIAW